MPHGQCMVATQLRGRATLGARVFGLLPRKEPSIARAQALRMAGRFEMLASPNTALGLLSEARKLTADLGDHATGAMVDVALGFALFQVNGATTQAIAHIERGASTFEVMNDVVARARALNFLGLVYLTSPGPS